MKLSAPKKIIWWVTLALAVVGLIFYFVPVAILASLSFWLVIIAVALILASTAMKGL